MVGKTDVERIQLVTCSLHLAAGGAMEAAGQTEHDG